MRDDKADLRIAVWDLFGDHVQHKGRVLERGADRGTKAVFGDERRADAGAGRMDEQDRTAPVHLRVDRLELGFGDRPVQADDVHVDADTAQLVEPTLHLAQGRVYMRQRQHHIRGDALWIAMRQIRVTVVQHLYRFDALRLVRQIG